MPHHRPKSTPNAIAFHHLRVQRSCIGPPIKRAPHVACRADSSIDETPNAGFGQSRVVRHRSEAARPVGRRKCWEEDRASGAGTSWRTADVPVSPIESLDLDVAHDSRRSLQIVPDQRNLERLANEAVSAVTPYEKLASDSFFAGWTEHRCNDVASVLLETLEGHTMLGAKAKSAKRSRSSSHVRHCGSIQTFGNGTAGLGATIRFRPPLRTEIGPMWVRNRG